MADKKALTILFSKYWSPTKGWQKKHVSDEDFIYAKNAGLIFDNIKLTHQEKIQACITQCNSTNKLDVVSAFISSFSTRRLDLRSALSSYACGQNLPLHEFQNETSTNCKVCAEYLQNDFIDLNILNFERHKFGGVRHIFPTYIWLDLTLFSKEKINIPTQEDKDILQRIIDALRTTKSNKLSDAEKSIAPLIKANKNERSGIISALGYLGILYVPEYQPFYKGYIHYQKRQHSNYAKSDWPFPTDLWKPTYGLNEESIQYWFGDII